MAELLERDPAAIGKSLGDDLAAEHAAEERSPVTLWDVFGKQGHPVRTTMTEMGSVLLSRLLGLSEAQEGALNIVFKLADDPRTEKSPEALGHYRSASGTFSNVQRPLRVE